MADVLRRHGGDEVVDGEAHGGVRGGGGWSRGRAGCAGRQRRKARLGRARVAVIYENGQGKRVGSVLVRSSTSCLRPGPGISDPWPFCGDHAPSSVRRLAYSGSLPHGLSALRQRWAGQRRARTRGLRAVSATVRRLSRSHASFQHPLPAFRMSAPERLRQENQYQLHNCTSSTTSASCPRNHRAVSHSELSRNRVGRIATS